MNVFNLDAVLRLDSTQYENGLNNAKNSAQSIGGKLGSALGTAAKVGAAAVAAATTAVVAFGKSSVDAGMTFDQSMSQVAATMGYTVEELSDSTSKASQNLNQLREFAQEMGRTTAFSATQAADALNYMTLAGYDADTSMQMLPTVLDLAAAGSMDLAQASDMVTDAQSALGLDIKQTTAMVDQMAKTASKSNTSVSQLGEAFLTIGASARNLKGGTVELSTVLGVLADNGIKGAEGGTHLRNMILSLQNPTKDSAAIMKQLNLSVYDSSGNMRSMIDIVAELRNKTAGMDQASRDAIVSGIFNKTDLAAVNALLGTTDERFAELTSSIQNADGAAKAMAETQLDNLAGDITLFQSALEGAKIAVSDGLTPTIRELVQFGTESLSSLTEAFKEEGLAGAINALGDIIQQGIGMLFEVLPTVTEAGIQLLGAVVNGIIQNLPALASAAMQILLQLMNTISSNLPNLLNSGLQIIMEIGQGILNNMDKIMASAQRIIQTLINFFTSHSTEILSMGIKILIELAKGIIESLPELINAAVQILGSFWNAIAENLPQILDLGARLLMAFIEGIMSYFAGLAQVGSDILHTLMESFSQIGQAAKTWGGDLMVNFINGINAWFETLVGNLRNIAQTIKNFLGFSEPKMGPLSNFHTYAPDMMQLFAKGITDNADLIKDAFNDSLDLSNIPTKSISGSASGIGQMTEGLDNPVPITVYSVLDGKIISESTTKYQRRTARAHG